MTIPAWRSYAWLQGLHLRNAEASLPEVDYNKDFAVATVTAEAQLEAIRSSLAAALKDGVSFEDWKAGLAADGVTLPPHAKTIWQTVMFKAFNTARYERFLEDKDDAPWLVYESVADKKTRANHAVNDGLCMKIDDPRWEGRTPQLGFNCRCILRQVTNDEAKSFRLRNPSPLGAPDSPEWGGASILLGSPDKEPQPSPEKEILPPAAAQILLSDLGFSSELISASAQMQALLPKLSEQEHAVLQWWTGSGAAELSKANPTTITEIDAARSSVLYDAVMSLPSYTKGATTNQVDVLGTPLFANRQVFSKGSAEFKSLNALQADDVISYQGFSSFNAGGLAFSSNPAAQLNVVEELPVELHGHLGQASAAYSSREDEVIGFGLTFKVVRRYTLDDGSLMVDVTPVSKDPLATVVKPWAFGTLQNWLEVYRAYNRQS